MTFNVSIDGLNDLDLDLPKIYAMVICGAPAPCLNPYPILLSPLYRIDIHGTIAHLRLTTD